MKHSVDIRDFPVPDCVYVIMPPGKRQDGFKESPTLALSDLTYETLDGLCVQFRMEVFAKAGKEDEAK